MLTITLYWWAYHHFKGIILLSADKIPAVKGISIAPSTIFKIMEMIRD
jgi:hypothetical protein